ncbi:MAG: ABC-F family ATP-binding cassette domain-containing protein [Lachnospiraceae bacterium]|nr:ABC-F family ATP-binding cassette domain-containing protein [Lachnospiraceae bacterium]
MIISCNNINKTYIDNHVLKDVSFHLNEGDKAALIGANGCGKTTLLKIIMGIEHPDSGSVTFSKDLSVGYLPQNALLDSQRSMYDEVLSVKQDMIDMEKDIDDISHAMGEAQGDELDQLIHRHTKLLSEFEDKGGYIYKSEVRGVLLGLGFDESQFSQTVDTLSGGQKTRVALAKLLLDSPDLIILDEPTNHLDMSSVTWLENYLLNIRKSVFIVSHDRYFLDRIVGKVIEIEAGVSTTYEGNYSAYSVKKEMLRNAAMNAYIKQQAQIEHQEAVIEKLRSFNREKSIKRADSRVKALSKIDRLEKPVELNDDMQLTLTPRVESGKDVLHVEGLSKAFGDNKLFSDISFDLRRGEHVAIIGDNGTGKTTLLKILNEAETADNGRYSLGSKVCVGYYDQEHHVLNDDNNIFEEISDAYPNLNNTEIRNVLAAFLFTGEDVFKKISSLSGGEKGRVSLAKLMLSEANLLILDEPTNHLDITSKEILESALNNYEGTLLYVSHDRYFINRTADRILELKNHSFTEYVGNYDYYLEKKDTITDFASSVADSKNNETSKAVTESESKLDWKAQKEHQAVLRKIQNRLNDVEKKIETLEEKKESLEAALADPVNSYNSAKLNDLTAQLAEVDEKLLTLMDDWEQVSQELEEANEK